ncbi:MAG: anti-sigma factor [Mesorhizobium sp.]
MSETDDNGRGLGGDDALAAEYVLGVLDAEARLAAAPRVETDPAFARLVDHWEVTLAPMAEQFDEVEAPATVKQAIDRRIFDAAPDTTRPSGVWTSLAFWRGLALAGVMATVIAIAVPIMQPADKTTQPMVATLMPQQSDVQYMAMYEASTGQLGLSHLTGDRDAGRDFELWVIEGSKAPRSLGVIPVGQSVRITVDPTMRDMMNSPVVLAISLEPTGGSTTGAPTGPVVAAGDLRSI